MVITYHGGECIKITRGEITVVFNPPSKSSSIKTSSFGADVVFVSAQHPDFNGVEQMSRNGSEPFVIRGAGEYEVRDMAVRGFQTMSHYGGGDLLNTVYLVTLEDMHLCFLGALGEQKLPSALLEAIDDTHVLFVPIGGEGVLTPSAAHELSVSLEPHIVIPIHYGTIGTSNALRTFQKEVGNETKPTDKLTIRKKEAEGMQGEVIVLSS